MVRAYRGGYVNLPFAKGSNFFCDGLQPQYKTQQNKKKQKEIHMKGK
jgi:hypothetical protein